MKITNSFLEECIDLTDPLVLPIPSLPSSTKSPNHILPTKLTSKKTELRK